MNKSKSSLGRNPLINSKAKDDSAISRKSEVPVQVSSKKRPQPNWSEAEDDKENKMSSSNKKVTIISPKPSMKRQQTTKERANPFDYINKQPAKSFFLRSRKGKESQQSLEEQQK